jgi:hypothetical protein
MGGVSFMMKPIGEKVYEYWIYICPKSAPFSVKQAVKRLRDSALGNTVPWGHIELDGSSILDLLIKSVMVEEQLLPSEVAKEVLDFVIFNSSAEHRLVKAQESCTQTKQLYEEH